MGSLFPSLASGKMWENFKLGKILENRNKIVKWNTVTYPPNLSCQGKKGCFFFFFFPEINVLLICQHLMLGTSHPPLPLIHTHSICINFCAYICMFIHKDSRTSTHRNTHWCREHKENCFRINYFYTSFQISFLNWGFNVVENFMGCNWSVFCSKLNYLVIMLGLLVLNNVIWFAFLIFIILFLIVEIMLVLFSLKWNGFHISLEQFGCIVPWFSCNLTNETPCKVR